MNSLDVFGRIEIVKAYVLKEFLVKKIDKLNIIDVLSMMHLKSDDFFHCNLEVKAGEASFYSIYEEIIDLVELYDLSKSHKWQIDINNTYLEIVSIYQKKLNGYPVNIEIFGEIKPYLQLKNLILLGEINMNKDGFVIFDDKDYKKIVEDVVSSYKNDHKNKLDKILNALKNGDATS